MVMTGIAQMVCCHTTVARVLAWAKVVVKPLGSWSAADVRAAVFFLGVGQNTFFCTSRDNAGCVWCVLAGGQAQSFFLCQLFAELTHAITSAAVMTSPNCWIKVSSAAKCSSSDSAAQQSDTMTTLKSSIIASRPVDSQQTLVLVPAINIVSIPSSRSRLSKLDEPDMKAL